MIDWLTFSVGYSLGLFTSLFVIGLMAAMLGRKQQRFGTPEVEETEDREPPQGGNVVGYPKTLWDPVTPEEQAEYDEHCARLRRQYGSDN